MKPDGLRICTFRWWPPEAAWWSRSPHDISTACDGVLADYEESCALTWSEAESVYAGWHAQNGRDPQGYL